jgi:AcrR family transcriptional regulator
MAREKRPTRSRDAAKTRSELIEAARWWFTRRSYDDVGIRDVAERVGVDAALVQRYFGSKRQLFEDAIQGGYSVGGFLGERDPEILADALATATLADSKDRTRFDPTLVMLRSAPNPEVRKSLARALDRELVTPLAEHLGGESERGRAVMVLAVLAGFDLVRTVLAIPGLDGPDAHRRLKRVIAACLET